MRNIAITGHRPKDLPPGYNIENVRRALLNYRPDALHPKGTASFITGGALGIDQMVATVAMDWNLYYEVILPFPVETMARFWTAHQRMWLEHLIENADYHEVIGGATYDPAMYQRRNERMVDRADAVFAFWTGKRHGGTANCIRYALAQKKGVWNLLSDERARYPQGSRPIYEV